MMTLLASLIGFLGSAFPDLIKLFQDRSDKQHELAVLQLQMEQQKAGYQQQLQEIQINADTAESKALYKTYHTGVAWVDALNGTVRPMLAYAFFALYAAVKMLQIRFIDFTQILPWQMDVLWSAEDQAIFAGIISFYFGQRAMSKVRGGK